MAVGLHLKLGEHLQRVRQNYKPKGFDVFIARDHCHLVFPFLFRLQSHIGDKLYALRHNRGHAMLQRQCRHAFVPYIGLSGLAARLVSIGRVELRRGRAA